MVREESIAAVERIRTSAPEPTDDEIVERYVRIGRNGGQISELLADTGAKCVADMPDGPIKARALALIEEVGALSLGLPTMPSPELRRRIEAQR